MKDNTKIRLHLSKQLFESLTKQVLKESKSNMGGGAYTEAVKVKKEGASPEQKMTKKMAKIHEDDMADGKDKGVRITLEVAGPEVVTSGGEMLADIGYWALKKIPGIAAALKDKGIIDSNAQAHNIGGSLVAIATAGTGLVSTGLAMYADNIKDMALSLRNAAKGGLEGIKRLIGKKDSVKEGDTGVDKSVEALIAKMAGH